uniref:Candidate secreted effector n=1 Tax=Meloidogyne incognita TaxID=6306 RepID=A0A914KRW5_MELIC
MSNCRLVSKTLLREGTSIFCSSIFVEVKTSSERTTMLVIWIEGSTSRRVDTDKLLYWFFCCFRQNIGGIH